MKQRNNLLTTLTLALSLLALIPASADNQKLAVKSGEKIAFMGDSITQAGARKNGYVNLVMDALNKEGLKLSHIPAGKSGNKSSDMLARLDKSVISKNPDWMTLSCGVNDVEGKARMFGEPKYPRNIQNKLTSDGCHMNKLGNIMMAKGVLRAFGLSEKKIAAAEKSWLRK